MKLNRQLFPSRTRGGFFAFLDVVARRSRPHLHATVPASLHPTPARAELSAHWSIDPNSHLPACRWEAALASRRTAALVPIGH